MRKRFSLSPFPPGSFLLWYSRITGYGYMVSRSSGCIPHPLHYFALSHVLQFPFPFLQFLLYSYFFVCCYVNIP